MFAATATSIGYWFKSSGVLLKRETQPYNSPQVQLQEQPKESIIWAMKTTKEKNEHKVNHFNVTTIDKFKDFKLKIPLVIDFIIPDEFNNRVGKKSLSSLMFLAVIE